MRKLCSYLSVVIFGLLSVACTKPAQEQESAVKESTPNMLSEAEKSAGWQLLFDGSTLDGWKRYNHDSIGPLWTVKDGTIICDGTGFGEGSGDIGGSLMTTQPFGNFELTVDWKITPGGNSGILYHVVEGVDLAADYHTGPEYQVMDDDGWQGGELKPAQKVGSNYDMFEAPITKKVMPAGEWNNSKIIYYNGHVEHWLNGEKTVEFEEGSDEYNQRYQKSKWVEYPSWNKFKSGAISLQDHGAPVYYRSIKIKPL